MLFATGLVLHISPESLECSSRRAKRMLHTLYEDYSSSSGGGLTRQTVLDTFEPFNYSIRTEFIRVRQLQVVRDKFMLP